MIFCPPKSKSIVQSSLTSDNSDTDTDTDTGQNSDSTVHST